MGQIDGDLYVETTPSHFYARDHPGLSSMGGGSVCPRLFAPADDRNAPATPFYARDHPGLSSMGGGSVCPRLFAPADDRNAPATPSAGSAIQSQPTRSIGWSVQRRCNGGRASLATDPVVLEGEGCGRAGCSHVLGLALQYSQRSQFHPRAFGNLHLSRSAANSDIPIK